VYVLGALLIVSPGHRSLANVWLFWAVGAFASVALALIWIWRLTRPAHEPTTVDWPWIRRGVKMSIVFTLGAFFLNAMFTVDRYILSYYHGEAQVGVYALYGNIANLIQTVAETGVAVVLLPAILAAYARGNQAGYEAAMRQFSRRIYQSLFFSVGIAVAGAAVALSLTGPAYSAHLLALGLLLLMGVVNTVAMIPHYGLYARSNDRRMALGNLIGLLVALALHAALVPAYGITGAAVASLLGMTAVLVSKILLYRQAVAQDSR
jgi:O-antigen/teichoic acid export membrane protein